MNEGDRRRHLRKPCLVKVVLRTGSKSWSGTILNYSESGVYVASSTEVEVGQKVRLRFRRPVSGRVADLEGEVKRIVHTGDPSQADPGYGLQFIELLSGVPDASGASGVFPVTSGTSWKTTSSSTRIDQISSTSVPPTPPSKVTREPTVKERPPLAGSSSGETSPVPGDRKKPRARQNRSVAEIDVTFFPHTGHTPPLPARVVNLSKGGMYLATNRPPELDAVLTVSFHGEDVDGGSKNLDVVVQATWSSRQRPQQDMPPGVGCRIVGFHSNEGRRRFEKLLRALLVIGNPLFKTH